MKYKYIVDNGALYKLSKRAWACYLYDKAKEHDTFINDYGQLVAVLTNTTDWTCEDAKRELEK